MAGTTTIRNTVAATRNADGSLNPVMLKDGSPGSNGTSGWTPALAGELDGTRTLIKVIDWSGGTGTKPAVGVYIGTAGYVTAKADAFNFNAIKRVMPFSAVSNAQGIATINYSSAKFAAAPVVIPLPATTAVLSGPTMSTVVAGSATKDQVQVKLQTQALVTGLVTLLVGATANVLVIES